MPSGNASIKFADFALQCRFFIIEHIADMVTASKNYITPQGHKKLQDELYQLVYHERPALVEVVNWAASNGDRSENGDYIYGKKRLRAIDSRIRFLSKRLETAEVIDPENREDSDQIFFGATVTFSRHGHTETVAIVGVDEADSSAGKISWISPLARALIKARCGDEVLLKTPDGNDYLLIEDVCYRRID